jgi:hypothetical protein
MHSAGVGKVHGSFAAKSAAQDDKAYESVMKLSQYPAAFPASLRGFDFSIPSAKLKRECSSSGMHLRAKAQS